ncbi:hypothetical protein Rsub_10581 [Raphidocelis subcapitata]|uniref:Protein kinase domain-containing protein n=1 Tax=Raphidocelis subcapitata TaxID=307507 RepID=A0A2V0PF72_9CHLO|nr:hypothetical protein Rsub_10581 [Raphidocelis subcapitata]|eukprot:GBF98169.1 hypothetical protein Rsub_10581 [Raphidocelis subcapitata]
MGERLPIRGFNGDRLVPRFPRSWYEGGNIVYRAGGHTAVALQRTPSGTQVAIKSHPLAALDRLPGLDAVVRAEVEAHVWFSHPRVPALLELVSDGEGLNLVFEYGGASLPRFVTTWGNAEAVHNNMSLAMDAAETMLSVVGALHDKGYRYTDMKPGQLLYDESTSTVKLVDLAGITPFGSPQAGAYTWAYAPPEAHARALTACGDVSIPDLAATLGPAFDVWGVCLSVAEVLLGTNAFHAEAVAEMARLEADGFAADDPALADRTYNRLVSARVLSSPAPCADHPAWQHLRPEVQAFLAAGLHPDPAQRATIAQLRRTEWGRRIFGDADSDACGSEAGGGEGCEELGACGYESGQAWPKAKLATPFAELSGVPFSKTDPRPRDATAACRLGKAAALPCNATTGRRLLPPPGFGGAKAAARPLPTARGLSPPPGFGGVPAAAAPPLPVAAAAEPPLTAAATRALLADALAAQRAELAEAAAAERAQLEAALAAQAVQLEALATVFLAQQEAAAAQAAQAAAAIATLQKSVDDLTAQLGGTQQAVCQIAAALESAWQAAAPAGSEPPPQAQAAAQQQALMRATAERLDALLAAASDSGSRSGSRSRSSASIEDSPQEGEDSPQQEGEDSPQQEGEDSPQEGGAEEDSELYSALSSCRYRLSYRAASDSTIGEGLGGFPWRGPGCEGLAPPRRRISDESAAVRARNAARNPLRVFVDCFAGGPEPDLRPTLNPWGPSQDYREWARRVALGDAAVIVEVGAPAPLKPRAPAGKPPRPHRTFAQRWDGALHKAHKVCKAALKPFNHSPGVKC